MRDSQRFRQIGGGTFFRVLLVSAAVWLAGLLFVPGARQERVFGDELFGDYRMPRTCAAAACTYRPEGLDRAHACYPALAYLIARLFPEDTRTGGRVFTAFGTVVMLAGLTVLARRRKVPTLAAVAALAASSPSLFAAYASNQVMLAIGALCLFFAWKDDETPWRRWIALFCLALAAALKIIPVLFALVLVRERRWRALAFTGIVCAALFFLPFAWCGGVGGFRDFLECLRLHADFFGIRDSWGFVGIDRTIRLGLGMGIDSTRDTLLVSRTANIVFALACLWGFWRERQEGISLTLLSIAVLVLPGGSVIYTALFLIPALLVRAEEGMMRLEALAWFAIFVPIQVPLGAGSANAMLVAVAVLYLGFAKTFLHNHRVWRNIVSNAGF